MEEGLEIDGRNVARAFSETFKTAKLGFKTETHFIPCHLSTDTQRTGVSLGNVRFIGRREAKQASAQALRAGKNVDLDGRKRSRSLMLQAIRHYRGFRWFAQVTVVNCADERSEAIALAAATSALDFLQLLIGARNSRRMSIFGQPNSYERQASIARSENTGQLSVSAGWKTLGQGNLPEDWTEQMLEGEGKTGLELAGVALEARLDPDLSRPLSTRLIDAVQWFGEAVRDSSPSTRLIKYVTALEHLALTGKTDSVVDILSERVSALTTGFINGRSFDDNKVAFKKVYDVRSGLAHGRISPSDPRVFDYLSDACDYSEIAIKRALYNWPTEKLRDQLFKLSELDDLFAFMTQDAKST